MATIIIDTHTHLCDAVFDEDRDQVLDRARASGVVSIVLVGEDLQDARTNLELAKQNPMLKPAAGLYPGILDQEQAKAVENFIHENRADLVAIGEVGPDPQMRNEPANTLQVVDAVAAIKNVAPEDVMKAAAKNTMKLYGGKIVET